MRVEEVKKYIGKTLLCKDFLQNKFVEVKILNLSPNQRYARIKYETDYKWVDVDLDSRFIIVDILEDEEDIVKKFESIIKNKTKKKIDIKRG